MKGVFAAGDFVHARPRPPNSLNLSLPIGGDGILGCKQPRPSSAPSSAGTADLVASILVAVCSTSTKATRKAFRAFVNAPNSLNLVFR